MNSNDSLNPGRSPDEINAGIVARARQIGIMFLVMGVELFAGAGRLDWLWAWVFLGISLIGVAVNAWFMLRYSPETVAERARPREVKGWDKLVGGAWLMGQYFLVPLLAGLDIRFGWTGGIDLIWHILGAIVFMLGSGLSGWAMISNAYFSTAVRIQADRGQQVCERGPYRYVRHPGYVGFYLQSLSLPVLLGSLWALLFAIPAGILMVIRTHFEDRMLLGELEGYQEYANRTRYRLIPGVW